MNMLKRILKLMEQKYPTNFETGMNPALVIYDDESGRIVKDTQFEIYSSDNCLYSFSNIDELYQHLLERNDE